MEINKIVDKMFPYHGLVFSESVLGLIGDEADLLYIRDESDDDIDAIVALKSL